jgi:hypothetical protein
VNATAPRPALPSGKVGIRLVLFASPLEELRNAMHPPWPRWMKRLYELEEASDPEVDASQGETSVAAAISALSNHLKHRLDTLAFVAKGLAELGFEFEGDGDDAVLATADMTPAAARTLLDAAGVAGAMCNVCDLDDSGWPRIFWGGGDA